MKRSRLRRTKGLDRKAGLARQSRLSRPLPPPPDVRVLRAANTFYWATTRPGGRKAPCAVCGTKAGRLEAHHIVSKEALKRLARERGLEDEERIALLYDPRNGLPLCRRCHERHTLAVERISRRTLPDLACQFASEVGLTWWLERFYPDEPSA